MVDTNQKIEKEVKLKSGIIGTVSDFAGGFWLKFGLVVAIIAAIGGGGFYLGYQVRSAAANKALANQAAAELRQEQNYIKQIKDLQDTQRALTIELNAALAKNQEVITKYVTRTVTKEIHDHPADYACVVPLTGWAIMKDQAKDLNAIRFGDRP